MRTRYRWVVAAILAVIGSWLIGIPAASAHTLDVSGVATCETDGTFSIAWTDHTSDVPDGDVATLAVTAHSPADSAVPADLTNDLGPNEDYSFVQTGIAGDETSASVSVHIVWTGTTSFEADATGQVVLGGNCMMSVVPAEPTISSATCAHPDLSIKLPSTPGIVYLASGNLVLAPGKSVVIRPSAAKGYVLAPGSHPFTVKNTFDIAACTVDSPPPQPVIAAKPSASVPSCSHVDSVVSVPNTSHVHYSTSASLTVAPGRSVTIVAVADVGYRFAVAAKPTVIANTFDVGQCSAALVATHINPPAATPQLAFTGSSLLLPSVIGTLLVVLGGLVTFSNYRNRRSS